MPRDADSLDEFDEPARPEFVGGDLRSDVSESLQGIRCLPAESLENGPPLASSVHHLLRFQDEAFVLEAHRSGRHRTDHFAADVGVVRPVHREPDDRLTEEHRPDERHVREVCAAAVRIVQDDLIALAEGPGEVPHGRLDRDRHGAQVDRDVFRLRDDAAVRVEHSAARVHSFLDVRRVGRAAEGDAHLLRDERQAGLEDF